MLLVTPDQEFLVRHPKPTADCARLSGRAILEAPVWSRPRQFDVNLLARGDQQESWTVKLGDAQRSAFYPVGVGEGLLLDRVNPGWRSQYSGTGFTLDGLLGGT